MSKVLFEVEDAAGRMLQVVDEDDGALSVSIFAPGQDTTDWTLALDDLDAGDLQLTLAAYLHGKKT